MDIKCVYFEVGNYFLYSISISSMYQPVQPKFSVVFLGTANAVFLPEFIVPLRVCPSVNISIVLHRMRFTAMKSLPRSVPPRTNIKIQPLLVSAQPFSSRASAAVSIFLLFSFFNSDRSTWRPSYLWQKDERHRLRASTRPKSNSCLFSCKK